MIYRTEGVDGTSRSIGVRHKTRAAPSPERQDLDISSLRETHGTQGKFQSQFRAEPTQGRQVGRGQIDRVLIDRATEIVDSLDPGDSYTFTIDLAALGSIVFGMWASAVSSSDQHQAILAILEQAVLSATTLQDAQISVLRSALGDLSSEVLGESHVEVTRARFIDEGFSPMALLSEIDNITDEPDTD